MPTIITECILHWLHLQIWIDSTWIETLFESAFHSWRTQYTCTNPALFNFIKTNQRNETNKPAFTIKIVFCPYFMVYIMQWNTQWFSKIRKVLNLWAILLDGIRCLYLKQMSTFKCSKTSKNAGKKSFQLVWICMKDFTRARASAHKPSWRWWRWWRRSELVEREQAT